MLFIFLFFRLRCRRCNLVMLVNNEKDAGNDGAEDRKLADL